MLVILALVTRLHALDMTGLDVFKLLPSGMVDWQPDCDNTFIEPVNTDDGWIDKKYYWQKGNANEFMFHSWFCPVHYENVHLVLSTYALVTRTINVIKCSATKNDDNCVMSQVQILDKYTVCSMAQLDRHINLRNFAGRVKTCMPWQNNGVMTHLLKQFPTFKTIDSYVDIQVSKAIYDEKFKPQNERVPKCELKQNEIGFLSAACWSDDSEMVFLKPDYKFNFRISSNKEICTISHGTEASTPVSLQDQPNFQYASNMLSYNLQVSGTRQWTQCKYRAKDPAGDWIKYFGVVGYALSKAVPETTQYKKIQFYDYNLVAGTTTCSDFVSKACVDNVFSFYGKSCRWVSESKKSRGLLLSQLLDKWPKSYADDFLNYGAGNFAMYLMGTNIQVSSPRIADESSFFPHFRLVLTDRLFFTERNGFSCSGCQDYAQVPKSGVGMSCGVPQQCITCDPWQRVVQGNSDNACDPPFKLRTCDDCKQHHVRSGRECDSVVDNNNRANCLRKVETVCEACPALAPMRRVGACVSSAYCGDAKCEECNHTQYFEKTSADGCLYFMSVADGLTFTGGVLFNRAYVDQYKPVGSTRAPEAVPALKYRNLMQDGSKWDASSIASNCEPSMFYDSNYRGILTRNVWGKRIQYRRWCGHDEMLKDNNAQLQLLGSSYVGVFPNEDSQLLFSFPIYPNSISLRDAYNIQNTVLDKERVHLQNRVAEIQLTYTLNVFKFHYEIRREGRTDDCTYCNGTFYTKDCGPTYIAGLQTPEKSGPGSCEKCDEQCVNAEHFFEASEFSCWSNGTSRVSGSVQYGSVKSIAEAMSTTRNYWYKQAVCVACKKLHKPTAASVPQIVTRCGNKLTFEVWHPTLQRTVLLVNRPRRRACCAINSIFTVSGEYTSELGTRCVIEGSDGTMDVAKLASGATPLCATSVPDLSTAYMPFCPPGWFFDKSVAGCGGELETWDQKCCSLCSDCATGGSGWLKTNDYKLCSGDTAEDTQRAGCVTSCAEKNYQVGNDTCVACESCG
jgi:Tfp pilus assembly protein FimT